MQTIDFVLDTLTHFVRGREGPPPGVPAYVHDRFEHELVWLCEWHGITPIIVRSLDRLALAPQLSRLTIERIKAVARADAGLGREFRRTVADLDERLCDRGVEPLWLQGIVLSDQVYPASDLRPAERLNLLVHEADWPEVVAACGDAGFEAAGPWPPHRSGTDAMAFHQYFSPCRLVNGRGDPLTVQFRIFDMGRPERDEPAWTRTIPIDASGRSVRGGSLEDHLILGCTAFTVSRLRRLLHAVDVGLLLSRRGEQMDWAYIEGRLRARSAYASVALTLDHIVRMFDIPAHGVGLATPGPVRRKSYSVLWGLARLDDTKHRRPYQRRVAYHVLETGRLRDKLLFLYRLLSPRREWVASVFGRPYRPWHSIRFLLKIIKGGRWVRPTG